MASATGRLLRLPEVTVKWGPGKVQQCGHVRPADVQGVDPNKGLHKQHSPCITDGSSPRCISSISCDAIGMQKSYMGNSVQAVPFCACSKPGESQAPLDDAGASVHP